MKILFDNKVLSATITALGENANFPALNMKSQFLRLKYKGVGYSDTITVMFPRNISANCFFAGYTNAESMTVQIYSNTSVLLRTLNVVCGDDTLAEYFPDTDNVRWLVITAASAVTEDLYIGGLGFGMAHSCFLPIANFDKAMVSGSAQSSSSSGQVSTMYVEPRVQYKLDFAGSYRETYHELYDKFQAVDTGHIWLDITDENHSVYRPIYCTTSALQNPARDHRVSYSITATEAR